MAADARIDQSPTHDREHCSVHARVEPQAASPAILSPGLNTRAASPVVVERDGARGGARWDRPGPRHRPPRGLQRRRPRRTAPTHLDVHAKRGRSSSAARTREGTPRARSRRRRRGRGGGRPATPPRRSGGRPVRRGEARGVDESSLAWGRRDVHKGVTSGGPVAQLTAGATRYVPTAPWMIADPVALLSRTQTH